MIATTTEAAFFAAIEAAFIQLEEGGAISRLAGGRLEATAKAKTLPAEVRMLGRANVALHVIRDLGAMAVGGKVVSLARRWRERAKATQPASSSTAGTTGRR